MTDPISTLNPTADALENETPRDVAGAARELGLKPVRAWVPDEKQKVRSAGAERVRRCREKAERQGLKQLSITVPEDLHATLKALAARTKAGEPADAVLSDLFPKPGISCQSVAIASASLKVISIPFLTLFIAETHNSNRSCAKLIFPFISVEPLLFRFLSTAKVSKPCSNQPSLVPTVLISSLTCSGVCIFAPLL